jgi:hypothetical protein
MNVVVACLPAFVPRQVSLQYYLHTLGVCVVRALCLNWSNGFHVPLELSVRLLIIAPQSRLLFRILLLHGERARAGGSI